MACAPQAAEGSPEESVALNPRTPPKECLQAQIDAYDLITDTAGRFEVVTEDEPTAARPRQSAIRFSGRTEIVNVFNPPRRRTRRDERAVTVPAEAMALAALAASRGDRASGSRSFISTRRSSKKGSAESEPGMRMLKVASGHAARTGEGLRVVDNENKGKTSVILKHLDEAELRLYERLLASRFEDDPIHPFVPRFYGAKHVDDKHFLKLENVTHGFLRPKVMDVKLGNRTFQEAECASKKPRPDMFERSLDLFPDDLTDEERANKSMTKARFMQLRDQNSTIGALGYRIDGVSGFRGDSEQKVKKTIKNLTTEDEVVGIVLEFVGVPTLDPEEQEDPDQIPLAPLLAAEEIHDQLLSLRDAMEDSEFVLAHEFIGTSLLFITDLTGRARVAWIDFAKTLGVVEGVTIDHRSPWAPGNYEDGVLFGVDNLVTCVERVLDDLRGSSDSSHSEGSSNSQPESQDELARQATSSSGNPELPGRDDELVVPADREQSRSAPRCPPADSSVDQAVASRPLVKAVEEKRAADALAVQEPLAAGMRVADAPVLPKQALGSPAAQPAQAAC